MTVRYVGPGGSDGNNGTSWATRKLTLNGVEDTPVVAGDIVYVAPGTYRETLTADVSGSSGSVITYIADTSGALTDGVGGLVRITGSDNDSTVTRSNGIASSARTFRAYRGFQIDMTSSHPITLGDDSSVENCVLYIVSGNGVEASATPANIVIDGCFFFLGTGTAGVRYADAALYDSTGNVVRNSIFLGAGNGVQSDRVSGFTVTNCLFIGLNNPIRIGTSINTSTHIFAYHNLIFGCFTPFRSLVQDEVTEDYNLVYACNASSLTAAGTNSLTTTPLVFDGDGGPREFASQLFHLFRLLPASPAAARAGNGSQAAADIFNLTRPTTDSKKSWGAVQHQPVERETTTTYISSVAALKLADAGRVQLFVPITASGTYNLSVRVRRQANYAGTLPQMVIKQPGQSDVTVTDTGSADQWNELTNAYSANASPKWFIVELVSNNTATSGSYAAFFDHLVVS